MSNLNIWTYLVYLSLTAYITVVVGRSLHKHGIHHVKAAFEDEKQAEVTNNLLLVGYYLINLGYLAISIVHWTVIASVEQLINSVSQKAGFIILILAGMHYINIAILQFLAQRKPIH